MNPIKKKYKLKCQNLITLESRIVCPKKSKLNEDFIIQDISLLEAKIIKYTIKHYNMINYVEKNLEHPDALTFLELEKKITPHLDANNF